MADWVPRANYKNPLFVIYHTLQFAKHKGMYWGKKKFTDYNGHAWPKCATSPQCENTFGMSLLHHRAELAPGMLKMGLFTFFFVTPCYIAKFCLHVLSHRHVLSPCDKTYKKFIWYTVCHSQQHCNTPFLFPRCVYRCA